MSFWAETVPAEKRRGFFDQTLQVAEALASPALATGLLEPFCVEDLRARCASAWIALAKGYGEDWTRSLLSQWAAQQDYRQRNPLTWLGSLPHLCASLGAISTRGRRCAKLLLEERWAWLRKEIQQTLRCGMRPSIQEREVKALAKPILGILEGAAASGAAALRNEVVAFLRLKKNAALHPCLMQLLRTAGRKKPTQWKTSPALTAIQQICQRRLKAQLTSAPRKPGDWSIDLPTDCHCRLCAKLRRFLSSPSRQELEWPLAKQGRRHVHERLDQHELPVGHTTRRSGSPYTLLLRKTPVMFEREVKLRRSWQTDLTWLAKVTI